MQFKSRELVAGLPAETESEITVRASCPLKVTTRARLTAAALTTLLLASPALANLDLTERIGSDVKSLLSNGPRVVGTESLEKATAYLSAQYQQAGYEVEVQTFQYPKFEDLGSSLAVAGRRIVGRAFTGSPAGKFSAPLVVVPGTGRDEDFGKVDVKGAIAVVRRGQIRFLDKARNAAAAGATGLIVVNTQPGELYGALGDEATIPVLGLSGTQGKALLTGKQAGRLEVNTRKQTVTGRNLIAHKPGVDAPEVVLGGHYDTVAGAPGANDNASGTTVVLEAARRLAGTPLAERAWFVSFDGEEDGLLGSAHFVKSASPAFLKNLRGMLNFDMVGLNNRLLVGGTDTLVKTVQKAEPSVATMPRNNSSDHASFLAAGVPAVFFYRGQDPNYHKPGDTVVEPKLLDATVDVALKTVQTLLPQLTSLSPTGTV